MAIVEGKPITVKITAKARGLQIKSSSFLIKGRAQDTLQQPKTKIKINRPWNPLFPLPKFLIEEAISVFQEFFHGSLAGVLIRISFLLTALWMLCNKYLLMKELMVFTLLCQNCSSLPCVLFLLQITNFKRNNYLIKVKSDFKMKEGSKDQVIFRITLVPELFHASVDVGWPWLFGP